MPTREETLRVGWMAGEVEVSFETFEWAMYDWHIQPVEIDGELAGMFTHKGSRVHFCILPQYRGKWATKRRLRHFLSPILRTYGKLTTEVTHDKQHGHKNVLKFGFKPVRDTPYFRIYELKEPHPWL